jgi:hypothetical protein
VSESFEDCGDFVCSGCGHTNGARCSRCSREMLCGRVSDPCPEPGCLERVISERYGGADYDSTAGPVEDPRFGPTSPSLLAVEAAKRGGST